MASKKTAPVWFAVQDLNDALSRADGAELPAPVAAALDTLGNAIDGLLRVPGAADALLPRIPARLLR